VKNEDFRDVQCRMAANKPDIKSMYKDVHSWKAYYPDSAWYIF